MSWGDEQNTKKIIQARQSREHPFDSSANAD